MTRPSADGSKSDAYDMEEDIQARIAELREGIARFSLELARCEEDQADFRAREDPAQRIAFAAEIFALQQDKLRLRVEIELLEKKIRRLELGYTEDAAPADPDAHPLF